ncbi:MAG: hypothetical protein CME64_15790 [Halobacteriovoraceae bacterium]|nr:hypothetical protein [Halobacteriovoraceae bacterium]|tara:strand:+ start:6018 stop:6689 length:672 start_codon:yes stop_codon:yes gene_type:complete
MANETQAQTLDETLNKTDLGHVINENKKPIMIAGVIIVLAVIAISIYKNQANKQENEMLDKAYAVQSKVIAPFIKGEAKAEETVKAILDIRPELIGNPNLVPYVLEATEKLMEEGKASEVAQILEKWLGEFSVGSQMYLFLGTKLAPVYENLGQQDKAISIYESLVGANYEVLEAKNYLELGRLQLAKGNTEKAKSFLDHVIKNHENTEYAKYARLYLQQIKK